MAWQSLPKSQRHEPSVNRRCLASRVLGHVLAHGIDWHAFDPEVRVVDVDVERHGFSS